MSYFLHTAEIPVVCIITFAAWLLTMAVDMGSQLRLDVIAATGDDWAVFVLCERCRIDTRFTRAVVIIWEITSPDEVLDTTRSMTSRVQHPPEEEMCCNGVLGYASNNLSLTYPCQRQPCCNDSDTVAVIAIDFAMGFLFQCMPRKNVQPLCYETGAEVRTTNQDPDFIPRACCQGAKFKVLVNQWYAAMVVKCVEDNGDGNAS